MNINQRKAGVILSYMSEAVKIIVSVLYTPIMLRLLGQSEYGLYQLVYSVVSYLSLLSLGFGSSYLRFYSRYKTQNDEEGIARLNGMFMLIFSSLSVICIICGIVMIKNINVIFDSGLTPKEYHTAKILMSLMVVNLAVTFPNSVFNCVITANEKFLFQKLLVLLQNVFNPFLTLPLLIMGYGSVGKVAVTSFLTIGVFVANIIFCVKKLKIKFSFSGLKFKLLKEMWIFTFFIFLNQIIDQMNWNVDNYLLGRLSGTTAVAIYGVGSQINTLYMHFSVSISNVFAPQVNRIVAEGNENEKLTRLFSKVGRIQFLVLGLILSGFIFFGVPFMGIWAGKGYEEAYGVVILLILPVTIPLIQNIGVEIQRAKNMHKTRSVVYFFVAILNVFISIPLIRKFGVTGAALGTALSLFIGNGLFMNWYYQKYIKIDVLYFWKEIVKFVPALIIPAITGIVFMKWIEVSTIIELIVAIVIYSTVYCMSMFFVGMNEEEKKLILVPMKKICKR